MIPPDHSSEDTRGLENLGALEQQVKELKKEVTQLKEDGASWVKKWGAYLGVLATIIAVPRAAVDTWNSIYQHPHFSVNTPVPLTIFYKAQEQDLTFSFPLYTSNYGTRAGDVRQANAHLALPANSNAQKDDGRYATQANFSFTDEKDPHPLVPFPFQVPTSASTSLISSVNFKGMTLTPGSHRLEVTLGSGPDDPWPTMPMTFCFELTQDLIVELSQEPRRWLSTDCE